jgi:hypothetical protein
MARATQHICLCCQAYLISPHCSTAIIYLVFTCALSALMGIKILNLFRLSSSLGPLLRIIVKM